MSGGNVAAPVMKLHRSWWCRRHRQQWRIRVSLLNFYTLMEELPGQGIYALSIIDIRSFFDSPRSTWLINMFLTHNS